MTWTHYLLQVNIYLVIFYAFYKLVLDKETYFTLNRIYLIAAGIFSLTIPFMKAEWLMGGAATRSIGISAEQLNMLVANVSNAADTSARFNWAGLAAVIYVSGMVFFAARLLIRLFTVRRLLRSVPAGTAFSFLRKKMIDNSLPGLETIHRHEEIHIRQYHTLDVLFFELLSIPVWCNPIIYLYKSAIKNIHEYLADEQAARFQGDKAAYGMLLLSKAFGVEESALTNNFFTSSMIKKRIFMLHKQRSKKTAILKYGLFLPLFAIMLLFSSATISSNEEIRALANEVTFKLGEANIRAAGSTAAPKGPVSKKPIQLNTVGKERAGAPTDTTSPSFPGGMKAFYKYLSENARYPEEARKNNVKGKVFLSFIVEEDGALGEIKVEKGLGSGTDEEALRLLGNSPKWTPGYKGNQPVRVQYHLPVNFSLSSDQERPAGKKTKGGKIAEFKPPVTSITNGPNSPVYYIDGVRATAASMNQLKPDAIESINVLKDEAATKVYGDVGKNGVILVHTKKANQKKKLRR